MMDDDAVLFVMDGEPCEPSSPEPNPCIHVYGPGPEGKKCKTCGHLVVREYGTRYYKCDLRRDSRCSATDHRVRWSACGKYKEA